jgi:hypothetical protein
MNERKRLVDSLDEEAGYRALRDHVVEKALLARSRHGPLIDEGAMLRILLDPEVVRFPTAVRYDAAPLQPGEFAWPMPRGERPSEGYVLVIHSRFEGRPDAMPLLAAYHVVAINYLDLATHVEAELFGATLLGLGVDEYYEQLCRLGDEIAAPVG